MDIGSIIDQFKKGIHTSEFWMGLAAAVWVVLKTSFDPSKSWAENVSILAPLLGAAVYAFCRTWLKRSRNEVLNPGDYPVTPEIPPVSEDDGSQDGKDSSAVGGAGDGN